MMPKKSRRSKTKHRAKSAKTRGEHHRNLKLAPTGYDSLTKKFPEAPDSIDRYQYVLPELRYIGIIAGSIILILIVLSFIL
jgi:hypothetical protein